MSATLPVAYQTAIEIRRECPTFDDQHEYHRRVKALKSYNKKDPKYAIAQIESEVAMVLTVDEMRRQGELAGVGDSKSLKLRDLLAASEKTAEMAYARWSEVAAVPDEERARYYATAKRPTRAGVIEHWRRVRQRDRVIDFDKCRLIRGDFHEQRPEGVDCIITDPPYGLDDLDLFAGLSEFAAAVLPDGGSLLAMSGQSYLPDVIARLSEHLTYHWCGAYLTPGGQAVQVHPRKVNTFWKPLLWFVKGDYAGGWVGDVCRSPTNKNDKVSHKWGQSEEGMASIVKRFSIEGDVVCDPMMGAGTTGVVALEMGRGFVGIEIDQDTFNLAQERMAQ